MEKEYNLLTRKLLAEGYTADNHPDYVQVCSSAWGRELWQNLAGGFEYTRDCLKSMVFRTGCGLLVKGSRFLTGSMSYMGIDWIPENDNPVITCPYRKEECSMRNPVLGGVHGGATIKILHCDCHQTDEPYCYECSIDKVHDDENHSMKQKYDAYAEKADGHVCHWQMHYSYITGEWQQQYDPMVCARDCQNVGGKCNMTHEPVSGKGGNVFYDVKISHICQDGTIFDGQEVVRIEKGVRLFPTGRSITICEQVVRLCVRDIEFRVKSKYHCEIQSGWKVEVLNIRAEQRESRDLMQDLQDIQNGIEVIHASDQEKRKKIEKKERRQQAKEKRVKVMEKKILQAGYYNMNMADKRRADKLLDADRIYELEDMRKENLRKEQEKPVQLSIFDMM